MSEESGEGPDLEQLKAAVRDAMASGRDLQAQVREQVLAAFSDTKVDMSRIEEVTRAALEGVGVGAADAHDSDAAAASRQAVAGIEDALMQAAEATSLAIREAAGHASEFTRTDLRRAVDELASLETLFIDTLADVAKAGSKTARSSLADIQRHLENSGSTFGEQLETNVDTLRRLLSSAGQEGLQSAADAAGKAAEQLGKLASSLLAGLEKGLADTGTPPGRDNDDNTRGES